MSKPSWANISPEATNEHLAQAEQDWKSRRVIAQANVSPGTNVAVFCVALPICHETPVRKLQTWVNWTCNDTSIPWPPEDDPNVFARGEHRAGLRMMTWIYPSPEEALALVRKLWSLEIALPDDLRTVLS